MTEPPEGGCCRCMISFIITSGFAALFLWLSLKPSNPTCSIEEFYVYALNKSQNYPSTNQTISYDLKLNNKNNDKGIYYDPLNLTFYYKPNVSSNNNNYPIGYGNYSSFYQGHEKSTHRKGVVLRGDGGGVNWEKDAIIVVSKNRSVLFRVELVTSVKFKIVFWKIGKRRRLLVGADLVVNDQGSLIKGKKDKGIKLNSGVGMIKGCFHLVISLISVVIFVYFN